MKLIFSKTGVPVIHLDNNNRLIFGHSTLTEKGYRYIVYSGCLETITKISKGKGKNKKIVEIKQETPINFVLNSRLKKIASSGGGYPKEAKQLLSSSSFNSIKIIFEKYLIDDHFPNNKEIFLKLKDEINNLSDILDVSFVEETDDEYEDEDEDGEEDE